MAGAHGSLNTQRGALAIPGDPPEDGEPDRDPTAEVRPMRVGDLDTLSCSSAGRGRATSAAAPATSERPGRPDRAPRLPAATGGGRNRTIRSSPSAGRPRCPLRRLGAGGRAPGRGRVRRGRQREQAAPRRRERRGRLVGSPCAAASRRAGPSSPRRRPMPGAAETAGPLAGRQRGSQLGELLVVVRRNGAAADQRQRAGPRARQDDRHRPARSTTRSSAPSARATSAARGPVDGHRPGSAGPTAPGLPGC